MPTVIATVVPTHSFFSWKRYFRRQPLGIIRKKKLKGEGIEPGGPLGVEPRFNRRTKRGTWATIFGAVERKGTVPGGKCGAKGPGPAHSTARLAVLAVTRVINFSIPPVFSTEEYSERRRATSLTEPSE